MALAVVQAHDGQSLLDFDRVALEQLCKQNDISFVHIASIFKQLYRQREERIAISAAVDAVMSQFATRTFEKVQTHTGSDQTTKFLFTLHDGHVIESVLIPQKDKKKNGTVATRYCICVSSQVGCALGCQFCATGKMGIIRNLRSGEIIEQILRVIEHVGNRDLIKSIVFMGMGEPLANLDHVVTACNILTETQGLSFAKHRVTVSTVGVLDKLADFVTRTPVNIALSLHFTTDALRSAHMPINRRYNLAAIKEALIAYGSKKRPVMVAYLLLKGINDSEEDAQRLATFLDGTHTFVNLIPYNDHGMSDYATPALDAQEKFYKILRSHKIKTLFRQTKGDDVGAACGMLFAQNTRKKQ